MSMDQLRDQISRLLTHLQQGTATPRRLLQFSQRIRQTAEQLGLDRAPIEVQYDCRGSALTVYLPPGQPDSPAAVWLESRVAGRMMLECSPEQLRDLLSDDLQEWLAWIEYRGTYGSGQLPSQKWTKEEVACEIRAYLEAGKSWPGQHAFARQITCGKGTVQRAISDNPDIQQLLAEGKPARESQAEEYVSDSTPAAYDNPLEQRAAELRSNSSELEVVRKKVDGWLSKDSKYGPSAKAALEADPGNLLLLAGFEQQYAEIAEQEARYNRRRVK